MDCCTIEKEAEAQAADAIAVLEKHDPAHACPSCNSTSRPVTRKTLFLMLKPQCFERVGESEYRFCASPECHVVYFAEDREPTFTTDDVRVWVGLKERIDPIPLCYCFGFDEEDVRREIANTGQSSIPQRISALIRKGMCACVERNPSGTCCLGEVNRAVKRLMSEKLSA